MFRTLVTRFLLKDILDLKVAVLFVFCAAAIPVGSVISGHEYHARRAEYQTRMAAGDSIPSPRPLGVVAQGVDAAQYGSPLTSYVMGSQTPDLLFVVKVILSLVAILMGAVSFAEEKQGSILKVSFAGPLPRHEYILAKSVSGLVSITYPVVVVWLAAALVFVAMGAPFSAGAWIRVALAVVFTVAYLAVFYAIGVLASVSTRTGGTAAYVAFAAWAVLVYIVPAGIAATTARHIPAPSVTQTRQETARLREQLAERKGGNVGYGSDAFKQQVRELEVNRLNRMQQQLHVGRMLLVGTPPGALVFGLTDIADTGAEFWLRLLRPYALGEEAGGSVQVTAVDACRPALAPLAVLLAWVVLLFMVTFLIFLRQDIA